MHGLWQYFCATANEAGGDKQFRLNHSIYSQIDNGD